MQGLPQWLTPHEIPVPSETDGRCGKNPPRWARYEAGFPWVLFASKYTKQTKQILDISFVQYHLASHLAPLTLNLFPHPHPSISTSTCSLNLSPHPPVKNVCTCFTVAIGMRTKVLFEMT